MELKNSIFTMELDCDNSELSFGPNVHINKASGKTVADMKNLLYRGDGREQVKLYDFFVGITDQVNSSRMKDSGLRYDVIVVKPGTIAGEYKKTSGHRHIGLYPEIYEVLYGTALFLIQQGKGEQIDSFAAVRAEAGEKILIPPGYSHATVNVGNEALVFSDLVADDCQNEYADISEKGGMCYYILNKDGQLCFEKNSRYGMIPEPIIINPVNKPEMGLDFEKPVYELLCSASVIYDYLIHPDEHLDTIQYLAAELQERRSAE